MKAYFQLLLLLLYSLASFAQQQELTLVSWNIRDFGKTKNSKELEQIAEIVREADIVAIQEVVAGYGGAQAVARLTDILNRKGSKWDYVISNPTNSSKYVTERYAFIWRTTNIKIKNRGTLIAALDSEVEREPFTINFYLDQKVLKVINFHSRPHNKNPETEISAISHHIVNAIKGPVLLAGDFNVMEQDPVFDVLKSKGFTPVLVDQKTTLKRECIGLNYLNYAIDNIFYSKEIIFLESGVLDFVLTCDQLDQARNLSDHLPVFAKFSLN
ncbi:endonuclease/exonuclease/phosphatase family metal-dependent hydrolase [Leeuwenhoekiella aestuarii]|uniref:Endonuclease/exonuclease/phosphatase family metal-dependent hydrolase n=1 Tax=Leeuwenhoekiella aestuarii TaxID=2249426 RepID=A0A4Q0NZH7_9FLAO|nr:endonuclease/exonuclease/phosphatase family protein [Leeuwenhoekiella aestuarii]RXG18373.1 endonuclease/exonuclease/phosphatase family metal-dependent hydrolase [Leeuwenhoekiella aestuarii]RXG19678.1 endonuclease/exonuclease/phosphatase family metal-dependent hydrolase [Leeuwenhoekiella aestuarii]